MKEKYRSVLFSIILLLGLFLPQNTISFYIQAIFPIILAITHNKFFKKPLLVSILIIIVFLVSFASNFGSYDIEEKSIFRIIYLAIMLFFFPFAGNSKISNYVLFSAFAYIFISQISYAFELTQLELFFDNLYPTDDIKYTSEKVREINLLEEDLSNYRYGGLFKNPNQCARYVTLLFIIFLIENKNKKLILKSIFIFAVFLSVLLTGSRSGMIVFLFATALSFVLFDKLKLKNIILIVLVAIFINSAFEGFTIRGFKIEEGAADSFEHKLSSFLYHISSETSIIKLLFGYFSFELATTMYEDYGQFDSEFGNLMFSFGYLGILAIIMFYFFLLSRKDANLNLFMIILLWSFGSTILFSYRMSFVFLLVLSKYYSGYLEKLKKNNENSIYSRLYRS